MAVYVICTNKKCEGPGVAEYGDDYDVKKHKCGFCETDPPTPMRAATKDEIEAYKKVTGRE